MIDIGNLKVLIVRTTLDALSTRQSLQKLGFVRKNLEIAVEKKLAINFLKSEENKVDLLIIDSAMLDDDLEITEAAEKRKNPPKTIICLDGKTPEKINSCWEIISTFGMEAEYIDTQLEYQDLEMAIHILFMEKQ